MGTQTMGSQIGVGDTSMPKPPGLSRQGSLYSLTLDEVENQLGNLGKPLGSLNIDELLRSVEATQTVESGDGGDNGSFSLSRGLKEKTVEEVWREIQQEGKSNSQEQNLERQNTLGEMTLEDFLVQAGVVVDTHASGGGGPSAGPPSNAGQHSQWMGYQLTPQQNRMTMFMPPQPLSISGGTLSDTGYGDVQLVVSTSPLMGTLSELQTIGRKRMGPGSSMGERTVERRQKRMIKNRESAARSRARKQAYTHELENKVSRLEQENETLRKMREVEKALPSVPPPQPKYQLRRTSSGPI